MWTDLRTYPCAINSSTYHLLRWHALPLHVIIHLLCDSELLTVGYSTMDEGHTHTHTHLYSGGVLELSNLLHDDSLHVGSEESQAVS